jgi:hypothetical protein
MREEKKSPGRNCFPPGLNFDTDHSARNDESIIHLQQEESIRCRPSLYGCTIGAGNSNSGGEAREEREPRGFDLQVTAAALRHPLCKLSLRHGETPKGRCWEAAGSRCQD